MKKASLPSAKKQIISQYKADMRFAHPAIVKLLNTTNPRTPQYVLLSNVIKDIKNSKNNKAKFNRHKIKIPKRLTIIIIDDNTYNVEDIEKALFKRSNIFKNPSLKYKIWLSVKYLQR